MFHHRCPRGSPPFGTFRTRNFWLLAGEFTWPPARMPVDLESLPAEGVIGRLPPSADSCRKMQIHRGLAVPEAGRRKAERIFTIFLSTSPRVVDGPQQGIPVRLLASARRAASKEASRFPSSCWAVSGSENEVGGS